MLCSVLTFSSYASSIVEKNGGSRRRGPPNRENPVIDWWSRHASSRRAWKDVLRQTEILNVGLLPRLRSLSGSVNNSRTVRECRSLLNFLSERFTSISLVWVPGHSNIPGNCRVESFRNPFQLNLKCHLPRLRWKLRENFLGCQTILCQWRVLLHR